MRTRILSLVAVLTLAIASGGCKQKEEAASDTEKDEKAAKKKKKGADDEESSDDDKGKKKKKKGADDDEAEAPKAKKKSASGAFTAEIEGQEVVFKYGRVTGYGSFHVELSNEKLSCKSFGPPSDDAYTVSFDLPAGPGGAFFAGQEIGTSVMVNHQRIKLKNGYILAPFVKVSVEPFTLKEGENVTGTLDFDHVYVENKDGAKKDWKYKGSGKFEASICSSSSFDKVKSGLSKEAPETDLAGKFGPDTFKPKGALAIVGKDYGSNKLYLDRLEFYETAGVDCTNHWSTGRKAAYFYLTDIGGTGDGYTLPGTQQPAKPWYAESKAKSPTATIKSFGYGGGHRAWVKFDKIDFTKNATLTGVVVAESAPDAKPADTGKISGKFEAKVCNTW